MKTITFYSYKGGVGRTLLLANMAKFLSRYGKKVFAIDFDLEAPGLHYKLGLGNKSNKLKISHGLVDYIHSFSVSGKKANSLKQYVVSVENDKSTTGSIHLMPAGNVPTANYWQQLAEINWHDLFYYNEAKGVPFFLELKARIQKEFNPDYLLIDSRTGITEIGGIATTILPEYVICLLLRNPENLDGAREVLRSITRTIRVRSQNSINIIPVLARLPLLQDTTEEKNIIEEVLSFLNQDAFNLEDTLSISDISILHIDRKIELEEALLIGNNQDYDGTPLLRDYIQLISKVVSQEDLRPHFEQIVGEALNNGWEDPDKSERELIALSQYSFQPDPMRALLKFYRVRKESNAILLRTARKLWELTDKVYDALIWKTVKECFIWENVYHSFGHSKTTSFILETDIIPITFIDEIWRASDSRDIDLGFELIKAYEDLKKLDQLISTIQEMIHINHLSNSNVVEIMRILAKTNHIKIGLEIAEKYKDLFIENTDFIFEWVNLIIKEGNQEKAEELINQQYFVDKFLKEDVILYGNLLIVANNYKKLEEILYDQLPNIRAQTFYNTHWAGFTTSSPLDVTVELGKMYKKANMLKIFEDIIINSYDKNRSQTISRKIRQDDETF